MEDSTRISAPSRRRRQVIDELPRSQTHTLISRVGGRWSGQWRLHPLNLTSAGAPGGGSRSLFACSSCDSYSVLKLWACVNRVCVLCCSGSQWVPPKAPIERRPRNTSKERRFPLFSKQDLTCWYLTGSRIWTGTKNVVEFNLGGNWTVQSGCWDL